LLEHYEECHLGRWKLTSAYLISIISMFCMANACPLPVEASNLFTDAVKAYSEKNYSYSLSKLVDYLRSHPSDPDANYYLALTYSALNRDVEAKRQYAYVVRTVSGTQAANYSLQALIAFQETKDKSGAQASAAGNIALQEPVSERIPVHLGSENELVIDGSINGKPKKISFDPTVETSFVKRDAWKNMGFPVPTEAPTLRTSDRLREPDSWSRTVEIQLGSYKRTIQVRIIRHGLFDVFVGKNFFTDLEYDLSGQPYYIQISSKTPQNPVGPRP